MNKLRVASVQFQHAHADKAANLQTVRSFVQQAREQRVELIIFPECCLSGYWGLRRMSREQLWELAEPVLLRPSQRPQAAAS